MIYVLDLDGTLIDSSIRHGELLRDILNKYNINCSVNFENEYLEFKRNGGSTFYYLQDVMGLSKVLCTEISRKWIEHIEDWKWLLKDILYDDALPFLNRISKENTIVYLSSRQSITNLFKELNSLCIDRFAKEIFVSNPLDGYKGKEHYLKEIKHMYQDKIVVIGDTEVDAKAANSENCEFIAINRGFRSVIFWNQIGIRSFDSLDKLR